ARVPRVGTPPVPLLDPLGRGGLVLLGLLGAPRRLPLAPVVLRRCHLPFLRPWKEPDNSSNVILAPMSSAQPSAGISVRTHRHLVPHREMSGMSAGRRVHPASPGW